MNVESDLFAEYDSVDELLSLLTQYRDIKMFHIGAGSNVLFTKDFDGIILHSGINYFKEVSRTHQ